ncbi:MAG: ABC transporter ATP-binding protein/permease [Planctomycetota bacterium]|jgi:ATP-binding cassette subfamily B protein|nr:ABC transporter ATP-binding protein/permease [Planctomycetota bacterium]
MRDFLKHITSGNPRALVRPIFWCAMEGLNKLLLGMFGILGLRHLFAAHIGGAAPDLAFLAGLCAGMAIFSVLLYFVCAKAYWETFGAAYSASAAGRIALAEKLRKLPLGNILERESSDFANMFMADYEMMEMVASHLLPQLLSAIVMPIVAFLCLLFVDWRMAAAMFACVPAALAILYLACQVAGRLGARHVEAKIEVGGRLQEYLDGMMTLKSYNLAGGRFTRLERALRRLTRESIRLEGATGGVVNSAICLMRGGLSVMILAGTYRCMDGTLDVITFLVFLLVGSAVLEPATSAFMQFGIIRYAALSAERIHAIIAAPVMPGTEPAPAVGEAEMRDVGFAYKQEPVLNGVTSSFPKNRMIALVGPSGSGKSTILRLLARFYDPQRGSVSLGGKDMRGLDPESVLSHLSEVFQENYLFRGSIAMNIRIGRPSASAAEVEDAARRACCHDFIASLPHGYDTMVGEGGATLSGGERQRVSIARSLLKNAPIVLLDEATASLDPENEASVQRAINELVRNRTVAVIAHKLKTVRNADRILVIDGGRIVEQGKHDELVAAKGLYARMWNLQLNAGGWRVGSGTAISSGTI